MRGTRLLLLLMLLVVAASQNALVSNARAQIARETIPGKWLTDALPEDLGPLDYPAYATPLDKARLESITGRYRKSLQTIYTIAPNGANAVEIALVKARSLAAIGRSDEALAALSGNDPRIVTLRAMILTDLGRANEAIDLLKPLTDSIVARYELGRAYETIGDTKNALAAYTWFVEGDDAPFVRWQRDKEKGFDRAEDVVTIGRAVDRWASLTSAYKDQPALHDAILNTFVRAYDVIDRAYWPAHLAAAEYYRSHDNDQNAEKELGAAASRNPRDIRALVTIGRLALEHFDFDRCDKAVAQLRIINRTSRDADLLEARNLLQQRRPADASISLERILVTRPNDIEALGLMAAVHALKLEDDKTAEVLKRVDEIDVGHDNASAYFELAEQLGAMRQYPRAAAMYKIAIDRAPWWTDARNGLGLLYTQSGDEDAAQTTLDAAHVLDPFNLRTTNYLRLLEDLAKFARKESEHFIVMYDPRVDPLIPEYFSDYLESIHAEVAGAYRMDPPQKTMIEVFPTHDAFSVRTTGSPWIGTVGASTGRVIALVTPRKGEVTFGAFNWANVLRHEYTHTVTLAATDNRIPHWMTEGLAVYQEHAPLRWDWVPMLYRAVTKDELFTLDNLTWGFVRPQKPTDRQLAYAQSFWICTYIEETFGHDAILTMLEMYRNGKSQEQVFPAVTGRSTTQFTEDFVRWTRKQVATWGYDEETTKRYNTLRERGEQLIKSKKYPAAVKTWEEIATLRPVDALPHQRLAGLYLLKEVNDKEKAIAQLKALHDVELKDNRFAKRIATLYIELNKLPDAQRYAMEAVYVDPYDIGAHKLLAQIAEKTGDAKALEREKRAIEMLEKLGKPRDEKPN